jgi:NADH-quinone oxidoreductase subunit B
LNLLQEAVQKDRRPLSWLVGPQETIREPRPSMRDRKRAARQRTIALRSPDTLRDPKS